MEKTFDNKKLKKILKDRGIKQVWVAKEVGVSKCTFSRIMGSNNMPRRATMNLLCKVLNLNEDDLLVS